MTNLEKLKKDVTTFPDRAKRIIVYDGKSLTLANEFLKSIKLLMNEIFTTFNPIIKKAHEAHKEAVAQKKRYEEPLIEAERTIKLHIGAYMEGQEKIRREAEEKARREEEERQKEEERILAEAKRLEDSGKQKEAESIIAEIPLPALVEMPIAPVAEGLSIKYILDTEAINRFVESTKGKILLPGIRIYPIWKWEIIDRKLIPKNYYKSSVSSRVDKVETEIVTQGKPEGEKEPESKEEEQKRIF